MAADTPSNSIPPPPDEAGCFPSLMFALFLLSGASVLWIFFSEPWGLYFEGLRWRKTPCTITISRTERIPLTRAERTIGVAYRPEVRYRYQFNGEWHTSSRIWFLRPSLDSHAEAKEIIDRYPEATQTFCYVNPKDPRVSVLDRAFRPHMLVAVFPLALALVGLGGLLIELMQYVQLGSPQRPHLPIDGRPLAAGYPGPVYQHGRSGLGAFAVAGIAMVLWNAMLWFLVLAVVDTWSGGVPGCHGWLLTMCTLPFVVVGLVLIGMAAWLLMKLLNPRPALRLGSGSVPAGGSLDVAWRFTRRARRIQRLRVYVEGREEATYRRGDRLMTDCEVFTTFILADRTATSEIRSGQARLSLPADLPPSFLSPNNRIVWAVCMVGEIRRWPNVRAEIEFVIQPPPQLPQVPFPADVTAIPSPGASHG